MGCTLTQHYYMLSTVCNTSLYAAAALEDRHNHFQQLPAVSCCCTGLFPCMFSVSTQICMQLPSCNMFPATACSLGPNIMQEYCYTCSPTVLTHDRTNAHMQAQCHLQGQVCLQLPQQQQWQSNTAAAGTILPEYSCACHATSKSCEAVHIRYISCRSGCLPAVC
jgi:hypothetical protein